MTIKNPVAERSYFFLKYNYLPSEGRGHVICLLGVFLCALYHIICRKNLSRIFHNFSAYFSVSRLYSCPFLLDAQQRFLLLSSHRRAVVCSYISRMIYDVLTQPPELYSILSHLPVFPTSNGIHLFRIMDTSVHSRQLITRSSAHITRVFFPMKDKIPSRV